MDKTLIDNLPIEDVIGKYLKLKYKGRSITANCPFHKEKTSSFHVSASKNIFNCFGCGKKGNAITFVMEHTGLGFMDTCKKIAKDHNLEMDFTPPTAEEKQLTDKRESLTAIMSIVTDYFHKQLFEEKNALVLEYVLSRWSKQQVEEWKIGYAADSWDDLIKYAVSMSITAEHLIEAGVVTMNDKKKIFDFYRNRIMFPIQDRFGKVISFSGRIMPGAAGDNAKYMNGGDTILYKKAKTLFGLNNASRAIRQKGFAFLVEGNPDVIKLQGLDKINTVAPCGTALADEQIEMLKTMCNSITIIGDGDDAGYKAMIKNGKKIIEAGMFCNVIELPIYKDKTKEKADPDTFFTSEKQFNEFTEDTYIGYLVWRAVKEETKCRNAEYKLKFIKELTPLIAKHDPSSHALLITDIGAIIKPAKAWTDELKTFLKEEDVQEQKSTIPKNIDLKDFKEYGFYAYKNQYFFDVGREAPQRKSNFIMTPEFHISSVVSAKRIFKLVNVFGFGQVVELAQKDMISLQGFKLRVESLGNFLWEGTDIEFNRLKRSLYDKTLSASEICQLGWQSDGFYAWSNGAYMHNENSFLPVDVNGIVSVKNKNYYLPAHSKIYQEEINLYVSERHFKHVPGKVTMPVFASKMIAVFGEKSIFCLAFVMASLFRDYIHKLFGFFPILNLFGQKGAGKTEAAITLLQFFGPQQKGPNMTNTSKAALADHVSQVCNACSHIDEYKNSVEYEKIEFLKGLWDGTGRTRMNMDKDKKKETTNVDAAIILSGQEMPTADIALFSRLIFISFSQTQYSEQEKLRFLEFDEIRKSGLTHITTEYLSHRDYFIQNFLTEYKIIQEEMSRRITTVVEDRILRNWLIIVTAYKVLQNKIVLPVAFDVMLTMAINNIEAQNGECGRGNEMGIFWRIFEFLVNDKQLKDGYDFHVKWVVKLNTDKVAAAEWTKPKKVLIMRHSRVFELYRTHGQQSRENILPVKTLDYYLKTSPAYLGKNSATSFKCGAEEENSLSNKRQVTTAYCFEYDQLEISVEDIKTANTNFIEGELSEEMVIAMQNLGHIDKEANINALVKAEENNVAPY